MQIFIKFKSTGKTITYDPVSKNVTLGKILQDVVVKHNLKLTKNTIKLINCYDSRVNVELNKSLNLHICLANLYTNRIVKEICLEIE
jgi:hypothetical protein